VTRRRIDGGIAAASLTALVATGFACVDGRIPEVEQRLFRRINDQGGVPFPLAWLVMQPGFLGSVPLVAVAAWWRRRGDLALQATVAGTAAWVIAKLVKPVVDRGRPAALLADVHIRHAEVTGYGWVSGHAAVLGALVTVVWPEVGPRGRVALATLLVLMSTARVHVGAHLPLDMVGGAALGIFLGALCRMVLDR
jgi:undecaprenyl-diphosphatase